MKFDELAISPKLLKGIEAMGFEEATPIQAQAIAAMLEGKDLIGQAQTGTGKTAAFGIPIIQSIDPAKKCVQAVILCPTRELAMQVSDELHRLCKYLHGIKTVPIYGGQEIVKQIKALKAGAQILVGTPGRTLDHMRRKTVSFENVRTIVLDEADEMLDMGFREDIEQVLCALPGEHQTVLFSATMPQEIMDIAKNYQKDAEIIRVVKKELTVTNIEQYYYDVHQKDKTEVLTRLLDMYSPRLSIIFCNTKKQVDELTAELQNRNYQAEGLHGDMNQAARTRVMANCRQAKTNILVATDVAARGIDIEHVDIVFNYDLPQDEEYYVHRIGRTGRAGRSGMSLSFVTGRELYRLRSIERYCKTVIERRNIPTAGEITDRRVSAVIEELKDILENRNLEHVYAVIEQQEESSGMSAADMAAALLYKTANLNIEEITSPVREARERKRTSSGRKKGGVEAGMSRLFVNVGKKDQIKKKDIVGAVAGEARIPGERIGAVDMYDSYTFVDVPENLAARIVKMVSGKRIRGRKVTLEPSFTPEKRTAKRRK